MADDGGVDFVLAAYREEGSWQVEALPRHVSDDLEVLTGVLRQRPADSGVFGLISVDEDFFVAVRVQGAEERYLLSDVTAATDWPIARTVLQRLALPMPEDEERVQPAGDLGLFAAFGVDSMTVAAICDEIDLYPEDMLGDLAEHMGFGPQYEAAVDAAYG
jgi:putative tRNA adenosine deaminase-associated protein